MRQTRTWFFFFLPLLYVTIVLAFIALQFSKKSDSFSQSLGDLTVSGKTSTGGEPAELTLKGRGLQFTFDVNHALLVDGRDGTTAKLRPLSWAWKDGNMVVSFQQGIALAFDKSEGGGRSLLIHPVANDALNNVQTLHVPFSPEGGAQVDRAGRASLLTVTRSQSVVFASVDGARDRIETDNTFVISAGKNGFRPIRIDPLGPNREVSLAWLTLEESGDVAAAEAVLSKYWDKAYTNWYYAASFSTKLVDAWGREALARGEYARALSRIQDVQGRSGQDWGFAASPYLGNIVELTSSQRRSVEAASSRSQPDWVGQGKLWREARLYGPAGSSERVKDLLLKGKLPETAAALTAVLQNLIDLKSAQPSEALSARLSEVQRALTSRVARREGELFVLTPDGFLDLRSGLVLGRLWMDYSRTLSNEAYGIAGARLVSAALARQDAQGKLPEILVIQDGAIVRQEGVVLPEEVYAQVRPLSAAEVEIPSWGTNAFLRSAALLVSQSITEAQAKFSFRFPAGNAEHIVIAGVPEFDHISMHGIRWRTDPQFQSYTDGWAYSASTKTLYVKIKHREELEELVIHFQPEQ